MLYHEKICLVASFNKPMYLLSLATAVVVTIHNLLWPVVIQHNIMSWVVGMLKCYNVSHSLLEFSTNTFILIPIMAELWGWLSNGDAMVLQVPSKTFNLIPEWICMPMWFQMRFIYAVYFGSNKDIKHGHVQKLTLKWLVRHFAGRKAPTGQGFDCAKEQADKSSMKRHP